MRSPNLKLITTDDGSKSVFREDLNETYHSSRGAKGESDYVFIQKALNYFQEVTGKRQISILEIGLGTGLNAFLTARRAEELQIDINYYGIEPYPLPYEIHNDLAYGDNDQENLLLKSIHSSKWEELTPLTDHFRLQKFKTSLEEFFINKPIDIVYFDAFAPSKQPELWSLQNLRKCFELLGHQGVLTTYCAQGLFKRNMAEVGFDVQTLEGALGKKEMVRGVKRA